MEADHCNLIADWSEGGYIMLRYMVSGQGSLSYLLYKHQYINTPILAFEQLCNGEVNIIVQSIWTITSWMLIVITEDQWRQILNWGSGKHLYNSCISARHLEADCVDESHVADSV